MNIAEIAPWVTAGLFAALYLVEHARNAVLTRDCMNRLQARDLREYAAMQPVLEPQRQDPPRREHPRARPVVTDNEAEVEAVVMEAREAWNTL